MQLNNQTMMILEMCVIWSLPRSDMIHVCHVWMSSGRVRALVWTASGVRHWKENKWNIRRYWLLLLLYNSKYGMLVYLCHMTFHFYYIIKTPPIHICMPWAGHPVLLCIIACTRHLACTLLYTYMNAYALHLNSFYVLPGLPSDNLGSACPDHEAWDEVNPSAEDQTFLVEQADQQ